MPKKRIRLGSFIKEYTVRNKKNENIPVYSVTNSQGFCTQYFDKEIASKDKSSYKIVPKGYFAYNPSRIDVGSVDWQRNEEKVIVSPLYNVFSVSDQMDNEYIFFFLKSDFAKTMIKGKSTGSVRNNLKLDMLKEMTVPDISLEEQKYRALTLNKLQKIINLQKMQIKKLDKLIKARFVEMFGDLKSNSKGWRIVGFKDCADIDTNMIHDFEKYQDYPHIGIDSIEKETGRLVGYKTIAEDGVISGKYLFTPKHLIYSKIRPNLNKVALPDFEGLCSADAYPILVKDRVCNREYLAYTMRSDYFLDYILAFSNRTNLPKVNKNQVEGFTLPLPPFEKQEEFKIFIKQVDKSKLHCVLLQN
ncbi:MAG TPA: restriction endonuclease subunit S [Candidatus Anaerostipes excrementavium]|uniref:Restriction endonuclease subunit S n=1 Tax=Candidatus Anaerostipes excrementavium TaxID=2838463 RepID=A0A9D2BAB3_9FIRM|nr:restriction endonuclease subunit S [uncultured Anaerostipes sp.]HIX68831.1 restriction endonuclease subunit S [Candidatus Anaerostipes excrementavium]